MIVAGNKLYDYCGECGKLVQLNKFLFGSLHTCLSENEIIATQEIETMVHNQLNCKPHSWLEEFVKAQEKPTNQG